MIAKTKDDHERPPRNRREMLERIGASLARAGFEKVSRAQRRDGDEPGDWGLDRALLRAESGMGTSRSE